VHGQGKEKYGRTLAGLEVDGKDVGRRMVADGLAWHYVRFSDDEQLAAAEREARAAGYGPTVIPRRLGIGDRPSGSGRRPKRHRSCMKKPRRCEGTQAGASRAGVCGRRRRCNVYASRAALVRPARQTIANGSISTRWSP
jgi:hypothetical protein